MSFDVTKAFDIPPDGVLISDENGDIIWIGGGTSPPADDAPIGSRFFQTNGDIWRKKTAGAGAGNWEKASLADPVGTITAGFGQGGNVPTDTWLNRVGSVKSNITGIPVNLTNAVIISASVFNENVQTYGLEIYTHDGNETNLTLRTTISVTSALGKSQSLSIPLASGTQVAAKIITGAVKNVGATVLIKGDFS